MILDVEIEWGGDGWPTGYLVFKCSACGGSFRQHYTVAHKKTLEERLRFYDTLHVCPVKQEVEEFIKSL